MRTSGLVLLLALVVVSASFAAQTATYDVYAGWNMVGCPLVPFNPAPTDMMTFTGVFDPLDIEWTGSLQRWDSPTQSMIAYTMFDPGAFGNCLLGDGYWLNQAANGTVQYTGVDDGVPDSLGNMTDMWVSLPGDQTDGLDNGGWNLISHPFNHATTFDKTMFSFLGDNILVTDGTVTKTLADAAAAGWLEEPFQYWNGATQNMETAGYFFATDDRMRGGQGYWVKTKKDNLALIIPCDLPTF